MPLPWHFSGHYRRIITGVTSELVVFDQWDCTNFYYPFRPSYAGNKGLYRISNGNTAVRDDAYISLLCYVLCSMLK